MFKNKHQNQIAFTLVELLVVIAIIGILTSIVLININSARYKAKNVKRQADIKQVTTALSVFYQEKGRFPANFNPNYAMGSFGSCDAATPETAGGTSTSFNLMPSAYNQSMQELVDAGYLSAIPHSNGGPGYCYYDFGKGNAEFQGAIFLTNLEKTTPTTTGVPGSCRPWTSTDMSQWCEKRSSQEYCICIPY
jgi:prepilin-type N-terminal cleavage/methylation domain-containing protein